MCVKQLLVPQLVIQLCRHGTKAEWKWPGYAAQDRSGHYSGRSGYSNQAGQSGQSGRSGQDLPYNADDPVLGTDMTQGEWDTLRSLLRKAEDGGKMNELMTVHRKEVKNAPMNRNYPPADDDWQECEENTQQPVHPGTSPKVLGPASTSANSSTSVHGGPKSSSTANAAHESKGPWKVPPIAAPDALKKAMEAGVVQGGYKDWKGWQNHYDPADDPWVTDDQNLEEVKGQEGNKKPILQLFGNVVQSNADAAAAKAAAAAVDAMARRAASDNVGAAGFPSPVPTPPPPPAKVSAPASAAALGGEQLLQELVKGKGKDDKGKGKDDKGKGKDDKGKGKSEYGKGETEKGAQPQKPDLQLPVGKSDERPSKCVSINEETERMIRIHRIRPTKCQKMVQ